MPQTKTSSPWEGLTCAEIRIKSVQRRSHHPGTHSASQIPNQSARQPEADGIGRLVERHRELAPDVGGVATTGYNVEHLDLIYQHMPDGFINGTVEIVEFIPQDEYMD